MRARVSRVQAQRGFQFFQGFVEGSDSGQRLTEIDVIVDIRGIAGNGDLQPKDRLWEVAGCRQQISQVCLSLSQNRVEAGSLRGKRSPRYAGRTYVIAPGPEGERPREFRDRWRRPLEGARGLIEFALLQIDFSQFGQHARVTAVSFENLRRACQLAGVRKRSSEFFEGRPKAGTAMNRLIEPLDGLIVLACNAVCSSQFEIEFRLRGVKTFYGGRQVRNS